MLYFCASRVNTMNLRGNAHTPRSISTSFSTVAWKTLTSGDNPDPGFTVRLRKVMRKVCLFLAIGCVALRAQSGDAEKLAPYYPTPELIVDKMLQLGGLKAGEKMF